MPVDGDAENRLQRFRQDGERLVAPEMGRHFLSHPHSRLRGHADLQKARKTILRSNQKPTA